MTLISINQAAASGIDKLRSPAWVNKNDHIKIDIIDGKPGPWVHLFSPSNIDINSMNPVDMLLLEGRDDECFEPFTEVLAS